MTERLLLTEADAAERLAVCQRTLRKARQNGLLPYILIGRAVRYTMADLESYIQTLRQAAKPCTPTTSIARRNVKRSSARIIPFTERQFNR
jgi:hypothetical protein